MARFIFGQSAADWTFTVADGDLAQLAGGVELTMWTADVAGTQVTDLLDASGSAITSVTSSTGAGSLPVGTIPAFSGPDSITTLWADAGGGARYRLEGSTGAAMLDHESRIAALEATVAAQQVLLTHALYAMKFDSGTGDYPDVPDVLAGQSYLVWIGPPTPSDARSRDLHFDTIE